MLRRQQEQQDQQSRLIYELCALVLSIIRSPSFPPPPPPAQRHRSYDAVVLSSPQSLRRRQHLQLPQQVSPAGLASLLLGVSLAMMLCGSVTFVIGFILMPWVLGLVVVLYFVGIVSNLSGIWRSLLSAVGGPSVPERMSPKEMPDQLFPKLPII